MDHFKDLYATSNSTDIDRSNIIFTKRQRERAAIYHEDHQHYHHPTMRSSTRLPKAQSESYS